MRYSDLHTHTTFSDGANTVEEMVLAALQKQMTAIGISDHSYTEFDRRYCLKQEALAAYHAEIRRIREKYAEKIEVYVGLEYDGYTKLENRELYDYLIGDCHYVKTCDGYHSVDHAKAEQWAAIEAYFGGDTIAYAKAYFETYVACTMANRPDILGHFDLAAKFGFMDEENPAYQKLALEALTASLEVTPVLELNTGAISRKVRSKPYPAAFLLPEVRSHGGKIILSSDAHRTEHVAFWFDEAVELLKANGFTSIVQLQGGRFQEVGI